MSNVGHLVYKVVCDLIITSEPELARRMTAADDSIAERSNVVNNLQV